MIVQNQKMTFHSGNQIELASSIIMFLVISFAKIRIILEKETIRQEKLLFHQIIVVFLQSISITNV